MRNALKDLTVKATEARLVPVTATVTKRPTTIREDWQIWFFKAAAQTMLLVGILARDLQNDLAAGTPTLGEIECLLDACKGQHCCHMDFQLTGFSEFAD